MSYSYLGAAPPPEVVDPRPSAPGLPPDVAPTLIHETFTPVDRRRGWVAVPTYDMREYVKAQILTAIAGFVVGIGVGATLGNILRGRDVASTVTKVVRNRRTSRRRRHRRTCRNAKPYVRWGGVHGGEHRGRWYVEEPSGHVELFNSERSAHRRATGLTHRHQTEKLRQGHAGNFHPSQLRHVRRNAKKKRKTSRRTSSRRRKRGRPAGGSVTEMLTVTMAGMPVMVTVDRSNVRAHGRSRGWVHDLGTSFRAVPRGSGEARSFGTLAGAVKHVIRKSRTRR